MRAVATLAAGEGLLRSLLDGSTGKARLARARWVVDLAELQHLCLPERTWVSLHRDGEGEWSRIWMRSRSWPGPPSDTPRRMAFGLQHHLRELGLELTIETPEGEGGCGMRVHVGAPAIRELVLLDLRDASRILEVRAARLEGRAPQLEEAPTPAAEIAENYWSKTHPLRDLSRRYGIHRRVIRRIVATAGRAIRSPGRRRIEEVRPPELVTRALRAYDAGGSSRKVACILRCSRWSARRFLERHGRALPGAAQ